MLYCGMDSQKQKVARKNRSSNHAKKDVIVKKDKVQGEDECETTKRKDLKKR